MYKDILTQISLSGNEAIVYEYLLKNGESPAGEIIKKTPLKRGVVYNALADLVEKGLAKGKKKEKVAYFSPSHPEKLREYAENKENEIKKAKTSLEANLPAIISDFNLVSERPGIRYYEGLEGIKKVINDTLANNAQKEIFTFSDVAEYVKYLKKWNINHYAPKRIGLGISEKVIIPDKKEAIEYMKDYIKNPASDELTKILFIDHKTYPMQTEVNIYSNKVSFVTFSEKTHIGVIIENKEIFQSFKSIFNFCWNAGKKPQK